MTKILHLIIIYKPNFILAADQYLYGKIQVDKTKSYSAKIFKFMEPKTLANFGLTGVISFTFCENI